MKKIFITGCMLLLIFSCVAPKNIPNEISSKIPPDSKGIELYSNKTPDEFYGLIYNAILKNNYSIDQDNEKRKNLSTNFKGIGQETTLRINLFVEKTQNGSLATLRGDYGVSSAVAAAVGGTDKDNLGSAEWRKNSGRPQVAFGELAIFANKIEHTKLKYLTK